MPRLPVACRAAASRTSRRDRGDERAARRGRRGTGLVASGTSPAPALAASTVSSTSWSARMNTRTTTLVLSRPDHLRHDLGVTHPGVARHDRQHPDAGDRFGDEEVNVSSDEGEPLVECRLEFVAEYHVDVSEAEDRERRSAVHADVLAQAPSAFEEGGRSGLADHHLSSVTETGVTSAMWPTRSAWGRPDRAHPDERSEATVTPAPHRSGLGCRDRGHRRRLDGLEEPAAEPVADTGDHRSDGDRGTPRRRPRARAVAAEPAGRAGAVHRELDVGDRRLLAFGEGSDGQAEQALEQRCPCLPHVFGGRAPTT